MYNTYYTHSNGKPVQNTFSHGEIVSVNAIIGLPTLTSQKRILDLDENIASSKTMQLWFPLLFLDSSPGLPIDSASFSASDLIITKQQTPVGKSFVIHQVHVAIGITDGPRHDNPPVTTKNRWEDDLFNGFI